MNLFYNKKKVLIIKIDEWLNAYSVKKRKKE
jgi:hypothetical protein